MPRYRSASRLGAAVAVLCAVVIPVIVPAPPASAATTSPISGGGSGFAGLEIGQWVTDVARAQYGQLSVNYQAQGSGVGRGDFANGLFDYGATDIVYPPLTEQATLNSTTRCGKPLSTCFVYVPVSAGGLGFMYNLTDSSGNRVKNLELTRDEVCKIFTGQIRTWDDAELVATNPELASFQHPITVVTRVDSAGESYVLSQFCIAVDAPVWNAFSSFIRGQQGGQFVSDPGLAAGQPVSIWPTGLMDVQNGQDMGDVYQETSAGGADGVANDVADPTNGPYAITYDAVAYANIRDFPVASVQNAAGVFVQPTETNVTVALGYANENSVGTFDLNFTGADTRAYFPSTYSYILAQTTGFNPGKAATLQQFLCYAVGEGQVDGSSPTLGYSRLSSVIVAISVAAIDKIPGGGSCVLTGPPPPAPIAIAPGQAKPLPTGSAGGAAASARAASAGTSGGAGAVGGTTTTVDVVPGAPVLVGQLPGVQIVPSVQTPGTLSNGPVPASSSGPNNSEALWALVEGAAVCALVLLLAGTARGRS